MCCCHFSCFYKALPYGHALILFIEFILGIARIAIFFSPPSLANNSKAVGGFILDWITCLAATLLGLLVTLTILLILCGILSAMGDKNKVRPANEPSTTSTIKDLWKSKRLHRLIQLNCNCPCYISRPRLRFIVRLIYLCVCFILRIIAISLYASVDTSGGGSLAAVCAISLACLAMTVSLDLYYYFVWWHYRPGCDKKCSMLSKKHKRYIPYHLLGYNRTMRLGDEPCADGYQCQNRTLEHIMIYHLSDHKPQPRFFDIYGEDSENPRYIGFHQTSPEAAVSIAHSDFMISTKPKSTMLGQGVYFARSMDATEQKANNGGAYICAEIVMGRVKQVGPEVRGGSLRGTNDWWNEYDCVYFCHPDDDRDEFCVKSPHQILQWVIVVMPQFDNKVQRYGLDKEFDNTMCGCI